MGECPERDVIYGVTLLETHFWGVHPRLYVREEQIPELRERITRAPWSTYWQRLLPLAEEGRLPEAALAWLLTSEARYRETALRRLGEMAEGQKQGSHWEQWDTVAIAYDWLCPVLPEALRQRVQEVLNGRARAIYRQMALHEIYWAGVYVNNISMHTVLQAALPALALYGDVGDTAPWVRWVLDRIRAVTAALGPDGVSAEGISYGGFFNSTYMSVAVAVRDLLGWDPLADNAYLKNLPLFYLYSLVPRPHLHPRQRHLHFGDSVRYPWYSPSPILHYLAAAYRDPVTQWVGDLETRADLAHPTTALWDFLWHDPSVAATPPDRLPPDRHFEDRGLVYIRSDWAGDESVLGFLCGAHAGRHALERYPQCVAGGHMSPAAGNLQLFAHGDWLLNHGAYARKWSAYHNVLLVDGRGQTGEGGEWFECTRLRREKRAPRILRFRSEADWAMVSADVTAAYDPEVGLRRWRRHLLALRPDVWIVADEMAADHPARFEILYHAWGEEFQTDRPFEARGTESWETGGCRGRLWVRLVTSGEVEGSAEIQAQNGIGPHRDREMNLLRFFNSRPQRRLWCVVLLEAFPAGGAPRVRGARWEGREVVIEGVGARWRWHPGPFREPLREVALGVSNESPA